MRNKETKQGNEKMIDRNSTLARLNGRAVIIVSLDEGHAIVRFASETKTFYISFAMLEEF